jgi:hypothetical protein
VATPAGIKEIKSYLYMSYYESFTDISDSSDPSHYSFIVGGYTINVYYDNVIGWSSGVLFNSPCSGNIDVYVNEYGIGWVKVLSGLSTGEYYPGGGSSWSGNAGYPCTISRTNLSHQWIPKKINGIQFVAPAGAVTTWGTTLIRISNRTWNKKI